MSTNARSLPFVPLLILGLLTSLPPARCHSPQAAQKTPPSQSTPASGASSHESSAYVGSETCKSCHEELYNAWERTPHWKTRLDTKGGPSHQGCEGCHGAGADHVSGGGDKTKIFIFEGASPKEINARC